MSKPVTLETLTNKMARELMHEAALDGNYRLANLCTDAINGYQGARERVCDAINARRGKETT